LEVRFGPARMRSRGDPSPIAPRPGLDLAVRQGGACLASTGSRQASTRRGGEQRARVPPPFPLRPRPPRPASETRRLTFEWRWPWWRQAARLIARLSTNKRLSWSNKGAACRREGCHHLRLADGRERETGGWTRGNGVWCAPPTQPHLVFQLPQLAWSIGWEKRQDAESALPG